MKHRSHNQKGAAKAKSPASNSAPRSASAGAKERKDSRSNGMDQDERAKGGRDQDEE